MTIPDRAQWVKMRDAAKVPKAFGKHDMGPHFEKFDAISKAKSGADWKQKYTAAALLRKVCLEYYSDLVKSKDPAIKAFAKVFDKKIYDEVVPLEKTYLLLSQPSLKLKAQLTALIMKIKGVHDATDWNTFWSGEVRGVGTAIPALRTNLTGPQQKQLETAWPDHLFEGSYQAKGAKSDQARNACLAEIGHQAAALAQLAHTLGWW